MPLITPEQLVQLLQPAPLCTSPKHAFMFWGWWSITWSDCPQTRTVRVSHHIKSGAQMYAVVHVGMPRWIGKTPWNRQEEGHQFGTWLVMVLSVWSLAVHICAGYPEITPDKCVLHILVNMFASTGCVSGMSHSSDKPEPCIFSCRMPKHMQFSTEQTVRDGTSDTETNKRTICLHGLLQLPAFSFSFSCVVLSCRLC